MSVSKVGARSGGNDPVCTLIDTEKSRITSTIKRKTDLEMIPTMVHIKWDKSSGGTIAGANRWNYGRKESDLADRSPGPNTSLAYSSIKGNKVILPKIGTKKFDKKEYIRNMRSNASLSSLES